jgi:hypothetical protein
MRANTDRDAIFISHANPEDNAFVIWLGTRLSALGYEVWADVLRLAGGDDWQRKLEDALRERSRKVLLVANPVSVSKQGVRNEIQIATEVAKKMKDEAFIIPLKLAKYDSPFLVAHAQYIDFEAGWARGLTQLLKDLREAHSFPPTNFCDIATWKGVQLAHAQEIVAQPESLISNWLAMTRMPALIRRYDFKAGISIGATKAAIGSAEAPCVPFKRGFLSCAPLHEIEGHFGSTLPTILLDELPLDKFLETGWPFQEIEQRDARSIFTDLTRRGLEVALKARGLQAYPFSDRQTGWWLPTSSGVTGQIPFVWPGLTGRRQIVGESQKRNLHWHYGASIAVRAGPIRHARLKGRLIFTEDGEKPFADPKRMFRLRRSFAKSWRNARWRDMTLSFLAWLVDGDDELYIPMSKSEGLAFAVPPIVWDSPVSIALPEDINETDDLDPSDDDEEQAHDDELDHVEGADDE